ncbi:phage major capsid protein [Leuconostoc pseudomesenteroides]|uniref:phage major capsid protein n=1 Tax=Leuconostoc pseudomesenteroides TaxID=33968 RepID=UPI00166C4D2A|nr:phage major capsid protein [Leuconostoc pseudomesenteroides]
MDLNTLNNAWIEAGHKVEDLQAKQSEMAVALVADPNKYTDEEVSKVKDDLTAATKSRDFAKAAFTDAQANAEVIKDKKPNIITGEPKDKEKKQFVDTFKDMLRHPSRYTDMVTSGTDDDSAAGLTIPNDAQTAIKQLMRQYASLESLVNVETVGTLKGSRNIEKFGAITPATRLTDQNSDIPEGDYPSLRQISYNIGDYADIFYAPNSLLADSAENILGWLQQHIARKSVVTRNNAIISMFPSATKKATLAKFDDVFDTMYSLDSALLSGSSILTNKSGFLALRKVKNAMGDYLIQRDVTQSGSQFALDGHPVIWVEDTWLPDVSTGTHPFYFGNYKEFITLFDRQNMSITTSTQTTQAFNRNQTAIRSIERFDTQAVDTEAVVAGSFKAIADQTANFAASATTPAAG